MGETLKRIFTAAPTFEREVPASIERPPSGTFGVPSTGGRPLIAPSIAPITGTRTLQARGAPLALSAIADFLTAFGAGVPAAQQQQAARREGIQSLLDTEERRAARGVQQQQQRFENLLAQSRLGEEKRRTLVQEQREKRLFDINRFEVVTDKRGNISLIDRAKLADVADKGAKVGDAVHTISISKFEPANFDAEVEQLQKKFDVKLSGEEKAMLFQGVLDANESQDVTPIRQTIQTIMSNRGVARRAEDAALRPSFQPLVDAQGRITGRFNARSGVAEQLPENQSGIFRKGATSEAILNDISNGGAGLRAALQVERDLEKDSSLLVKAAIPGNIGARAFAATRAEMVDVKTRFRTGAALNEEEQRFYTNQAPGALDSGNPEAIRRKTNLFKSLYRSKLDGLGAKVTYKVTTPTGAAATRILGRLDAEKLEDSGFKLEFVKVE